MKIIVSQHWRREMLATVAIELLGILASFVWWYEKNIGLFIIMVCFIIFLMSFCQVIGIVLQHRYLCHVIYENNKYTSFFLNKKLCTITEDACIYYTKINISVSTRYRADYIFISNEPFEYRDIPELRIFPWQPKPIQYTYDMKKMIMLPYKENAPYLSKMHEWTRIYPS